MSSKGTVYIEAIRAVYNAEVCDTDRERAVTVEPGEATTVSFDQFIPTAKVMAEDVNRFEALRFIYRNWERSSPDYFDKDLIAVLIEMYELAELWTGKKYHTCVLRACSFFEEYFIQASNISKDTAFHSAINSAYSNDIISENEMKLYMFVKEVRNDCAHNNWIEIDYSTAVLVFACTTSNFLIGELAHRKLNEYGPALESIVDAEPYHFLRKLEEEFDWKCEESNGDIKWRAPESWDHPEDGKYASYNDAYNDILRSNHGEQ